MGALSWITSTMEKQKNILARLVLLLSSLNSCDTRDDYFLEHGEAPIVEMTTANDTMNSEFWNGKKYRIIEVGFGKSDTLFLSINDPYGKECTYDLKLESLPEDNELNGVYAEELMYYLGEDVCTEDNKATTFSEGRTKKYASLDYYRTIGCQFVDPFLKCVKTSNKIVFYLEKRTETDYVLPQKKLPHDYLKQILNYARPHSSLDMQYYDASDKLVHEIPFSKEISARYVLTVKNKIGKETNEYVVVKIKPNKQPKPTLSAICINKETNEYKITAGGTDPNGHKIVKWSYVFDYIPFNIGSKILQQYEIDLGYLGSDNYVFDGYLYYDSFESVAITYTNYEELCFYYSTFGMGKKIMKEWKIEADFITPTTKNEVYHVFQTKGEHTVSVRCQDEFGLWSDYITEKIYVE